jgi:hypothetical protein
MSHEEQRKKILNENKRKKRQRHESHDRTYHPYICFSVQGERPKKKKKRNRESVTKKKRKSLNKKMKKG